MKTYSASASTLRKHWYLVDAEDKILGRLASKIAHYLQGKHKPEYSPNIDTGDYIIVINADKVRVTGAKFDDKIYYRHSGYVGGIKSVSYGKLIADFPERPLMMAVKGMLPKGPLGRSMLKKLRIYSGNEHPHSAQQPESLVI